MPGLFYPRPGAAPLAKIPAVTLSLLLALLGSCSPQGVFLRIRIQDAPDAAASLAVYGILHSDQAPGILAHEQRSLPLPQKPALTLGLAISGTAAGQLTTTVGALDGDGCVIATGDASVNVKPGDTVLDLNLALTLLAKPLCQPDALTLLRVTPSEILTTGRNTSGDKGLDIYGWGFRPGMRVVVGDYPQCARVASYQHLVIDAPQLAQPSGPAAITLSLPDQPVVSSGQLLAVVLTSFPGQYSTPRQTLLAGKLIDVAVGDVDLDGRPDVVLLDELGQLWLRQNPATLDAGKPGLSGAMTPVYSVPGFNLGHTGALAVADVDGQPGVEIVVVTEVGGAVLKRQPDGSFAPLVADPRLQGRDVVLVDLDGHSGPELVRAGATLVVHPNPGNGRYDPAPPPGLAIVATALAAVDLNGDGRPDVVALAQNSPDFIVLLNSGGQLAAPSVLPLRNSTCPAPAALAVQDLNGDGLLDVAINGSAAILLGSKDGYAVTYIAGAGSCLGGVGLAAADVNGDGTQDLIWLDAAVAPPMLN